MKKNVQIISLAGLAQNGLEVQPRGTVSPSGGSHERGMVCSNVYQISVSNFSLSSTRAFLTLILLLILLLE